MLSIIEQVREEHANKLITSPEDNAVSDHIEKINENIRRETNLAKARDRVNGAKTEEKYQEAVNQLINTSRLAYNIERFKGLSQQQIDVKRAHDSRLPEPDLHKPYVRHPSQRHDVIPATKWVAGENYEVIDHKKAKEPALRPIPETVSIPFSSMSGETVAMFWYDEHLKKWRFKGDCDEAAKQFVNM